MKINEKTESIKQRRGVTPKPDVGSRSRQGYVKPGSTAGKMVNPLGKLLEAKQSITYWRHEREQGSPIGGPCEWGHLFLVFLSLALWTSKIVSVPQRCSQVLAVG